MADRAAALLALLPLALDTFAASAALAAVAGRRRRTSLVLAGFEGCMPIAGAVVGGSLAGAVGGAAERAAGAVLVVVSIAMLVRGEAAEERRLRGFATSGGAALVALGFAVSVDELAVGFSLGLTGVSPVVLGALLAAQAFVAAELGMRVGERLAEVYRERVEQAAALGLLAVAIWLLVR